MERQLARSEHADVRRAGLYLLGWLSVQTEASSTVWMQAWWFVL
jgi:hypothetical protein